MWSRQWPLAMNSNKPSVTVKMTIKPVCRTPTPTLSSHHYHQMFWDFTSSSWLRRAGGWGGGRGGGAVLLIGLTISLEPHPYRWKKKPLEGLMWREGERMWVPVNADRLQPLSHHQPVDPDLHPTTQSSVELYCFLPHSQLWDCTACYHTVKCGTVMLPTTVKCGTVLLPTTQSSVGLYCFLPHS